MRQNELTALDNIDTVCVCACVVCLNKFSYICICANTYTKPFEAKHLPFTFTYSYFS